MINGNTKISDLSDDLENQNELKHKAHEYGSIDKDFYDKLPEWVTYNLDNMDKKFYGRPWFEEAWQKYRDHVMNSEMKNIRAPGYVFNDYIKKDKDLNPADVRYGLEGDYYLYPELRSEKERKDDAKSVCYSEEDIDSLKHDDRVRYKDVGLKGNGGWIAPKEFQNSFTKADEKELQILTKQNKLAEARSKKFQREMSTFTKQDEAYGKAITSTKDMADGIKNVANDVNKLIPEKTGKTIKGQYPDLSDAELQKRLNRINLEQRYSDAVGDTKYVESGKDKAKKALGIFAVGVDAAAAGLGIALLIMRLKGQSQANRVAAAKLAKLKK